MTLAFTYFYFLATLHGMWDLVPQGGVDLQPLQWKHRILTTGPPGKSQYFTSFNYCFFILLLKSGGESLSSLIFLLIFF